jgi:hypothetical protein
MSMEKIPKGILFLGNSLVAPISNATAFGLDPMPIAPVKIINRLSRKKDGFIGGEVSFGKGFVSVRIPRNSGRTLWSVI